MTTAYQQELQSLIQRQLANVASFQEHLNLARNFATDDRILAFINHTLDEEAERIVKLKTLLAQVEALPAAEMAEAPSAGPMPLTPGAGGHYRLRDQNELTVGSLVAAG